MNPLPFLFDRWHHIPPFHLSLEGISYTAVIIAVFYFVGLWPLALLRRPLSFTDIWTLPPLFGLAVTVFACSNPNYAGIPVWKSTFALLVFSFVADCYVLWKVRPSFVRQRESTVALLIALGGTLLFVVPFVFFGGYHYFGDSLYYASVADFVRDRGYFSRTEAPFTYPWVSQFLFARLLSLRMGTQYVLSFCSILLGAKSSDVFLQTSGAFLFISFCGFWRMVTVLLPGSTRLRLIALTAYCSNIMLVYWPLAMNFMSQTPGLGLMYAWVGAMLDQKANLRSRALIAALTMSPLISIYPELLPFAVIPVGAYFAMAALRRWEERATLCLLAAATVGGALLNPYAVVTSVRGILIQMNIKPGWEFIPKSPTYVEYLFGVVVPGFSENLLFYLLAVMVAAGALAICVLGFGKLTQQAKAVVVSVLVVYAGVGLYENLVVRYHYGFLKVFVFGLFIVPLCIGAGYDELLARVKNGRLGLITRAHAWAWGGLTVFAAVAFIANCYGTGLNASYWPSMSAAQVLESFRDLSALARLVAPTERTLVAVKLDDYDLWIPYYFRKPVGDYFKSVHYTIDHDLPIADPQAYQYVIADRKETRFANDNQILFRNPLFAFSRNQAFLILGDGWFADDTGADQIRWMGQKGHVIVFSPRTDTVQLRAVARLTPDRQNRHLRVVQKDKTIASYEMNRDGFEFTTPALAVEPGLNDVVIEVEEPARRYGADTRLLGVPFAMVDFLRDPPAQLTFNTPEHTRFAEGLSPDHWVGPEGIKIAYPRHLAPSKSLTIAGEVPPFAPVLPQTLRISWEGKTTDLVLRQAGPFSKSVDLPAPGGQPLEIKITADKFFCPKALGVNDDPRELGVLLRSIDLR